jgi:SAM-dependent methyltransferase
MWDQRYNEQGYAYGTAPNDFLVSVADRIPTGRVLCLAEGEGRNAVYLAARGHEVVAVDQSLVGLDKARRLAESRGVHLETVQADLADFEIAPGGYSGIVSVFVHLPPALRARLHGDVVRGLRPGGAFVLEAFTPAQLELGTGGPKVAELMMDLKVLRNELVGLDLEIARELGRDIHEGRYHQGRSAVVQVLGFKQRTA